MVYAALWPSHTQTILRLQQQQACGKPICWEAEGLVQGKKTLAAQGLSHDLVVKYQDANGKERWKGSSKLRSSQYATYLFGPLVQFAFILHSTKTCVEKNIGFAMHMFPQWFSLCLYMNANNSERIMYVADFFTKHIL